MLAFTLLIVYRKGFLLPGDPLYALPFDHHKYLYMAEYPFTLHVAPFCWRIGAPLLAGSLPFSLLVNFSLLAVLGVVLSACFLFLLTRSFGFSLKLAWLGLALFFILPGTLYAVWNIWLPDGLSFAFISLSILLLVRRKFAAFAICAALGVIVKETSLFVLPLAYSLTAARWLDGQAARRALLLSIPALLTFVLIRAVIPSYNGDPLYLASLGQNLAYVGTSGPYNLLLVIPQILAQRLPGLTPFSFFTDYILSPFGPAAVLPFFAPRKNALLFLRFLPLLLAAYAQVLAALNTDRLLVVAFPAVVLLSLNALDRKS